MIGTWGRAALLAALRAYKLIVSPWLPSACRYTPTCSDYASDAIARFGVWRGGRKAVRRLLSCHPWARGGWDPAA